MTQKTTSVRPQTESRARAYALLAPLGVIWRLAFVAIRYADFELSPPSPADQVVFTVIGGAATLAAAALARTKPARSAANP